MLIGGSYDTLATTIYLQVTGAYDSTGAAAMSVVLLSLTVILFLIQKYYLEKKTAATLTGKASRMRMLIEDKSVTVPLTIFCGVVAAFVLLMYIMVPFGALFTLWGRDYSLSLKWFQYMFKTSGLKAFKDSFLLSLIASPLTAFLSMVISYLVVKKKFKLKGFIEFGVHAGHGGTWYGTWYRVYPGICQWTVSDRTDERIVRNGSDPDYCVYCAKPSNGNQKWYFGPAPD